MPQRQDATVKPALSKRSSKVGLRSAAPATDRAGVASLAGTVLGMLVTDLNHFLGLSQDAHNDHAILAATGDDLDELTGFVAAEANSEPNRRRQQRLGAAFDALNTATRTPGG